MLTSTPTYDTINKSIERLNDIAAAHERLSRYEAEALLDRIEGEAREVRKLIKVLADRDG